MEKSKISKKILPVFAVAFWILVWFAVSRITDLELLLPSPAAVAKRLGELIISSEFYRTLLFSFLRITSGYAAAFIAGIFLAFASYFSKCVEGLLSPLMTVVKATPVASFIVMVFLWLSRNAIPGFISFLMVLPIVYEGVLFALKNMPKRTLEVMKIFHINGKRKFVIYFRAISKSVLSAAKTSLGLAWKAGVAAEVISAPKTAIGTEILNAKTYLESADLYAWTAAVIIISVSIQFIAKRMVRKRAW